MFRSEVYRVPQEKTNVSAPHDDEGDYYCDMCDEGGWDSETELEIHRQYIHTDILCNLLNNKNKIVCFTCKREQPDRKTLYNHIKEEHLLSSKNAVRVEREIYICDYCCHIFFNKLLLASHIQRKHWPKTTKRIIECPKCLKMVTPQFLYGHAEMHQLQSISLCPICLEKCINRSDLAVHLRSHMKHYYCNICQYSTKRENYYQTHINHHKKYKVPYQGDFARYYIPVKGVLKKKFLTPFPIKGLPLWNNVHICILCREICLSRHKMQLHVSEHIEPKVTLRKRHVCVCGEEFFNNVLLKHHVFKLKGSHSALDEEYITINVPMKSQDVYVIPQ
ncbi:PR domain zinc finger protein 5-like [Galleria mellonella]|uniref:PR domain zinc finger protein 5-like n=1 Tax=Galleria mellonella TaxID=7137 RepID=A0ABM3MAF7_GALME|nr:PR domain zinc finger protein 5-like [Galleria mellonella]